MVAAGEPRHLPRSEGQAEGGAAAAAAAVFGTADPQSKSSASPPPCTRFRRPALAGTLRAAKRGEADGSRDGDGESAAKAKDDGTLFGMGEGVKVNSGAAGAKISA